MKILTVVGARPQFVKAAVVSRALRKKATEVLVHTGQHYDLNMSGLFFKELEIPAPDYNLGIGSGSHGAQTGKMLEAVERILITEKPDVLLVYGDTNSTLAGALAAAKLHIPVAHVEAGLRSFNRQMPEEINRVIADHLAKWLFAPTKTAVGNLATEGIEAGVFLVGDVMYDSFLAMAEIARKKSQILANLDLTPGEYYLLTLHRAENTDVRERLEQILKTLENVDKTVVFPVHPRTKSKINDYGLKIGSGAIRMIDPVGYLEMLQLELNTAAVLTDSGGVQKEAYMAKVPCITLRDETEWVETVGVNWNRIAGSDPEAILRALNLDWVGNEYPLLFGDGAAAQHISDILLKA